MLTHLSIIILNFLNEEEISYLLEINIARNSTACDSFEKKTCREFRL